MKKNNIKSKTTVRRKSSIKKSPIKKKSNLSFNTKLGLTSLISALAGYNVHKLKTNIDTNPNLNNNLYGSYGIHPKSPVKKKILNNFFSN